MTFFDVCYAESQNNVSDISIEHSKLSVQGTHIVDLHNKPTRIKSFEHHMIRGNLDEEGILWIKQQGFNTIRVSIFWHALETADGIYDPKMVQKLDNIIRWCEENRIYIWLNIHQWQLSPHFKYYGTGLGFPSWLVSEGRYSSGPEGHKRCGIDFFTNKDYGKVLRSKFVSIWVWLLHRYKHIKYLAFYEIINEPMVARFGRYPAKAHIGCMSFYLEMTNVIRSIDPDTIIIYHWLDLHAQKPVTYNNIVWTGSHYKLRNLVTIDSLIDYFNKIKWQYNVRLGTPWMISEMGVQENENQNNVINWMMNTYDAMRIVKLNDGYECWNWYHYYKGPRRAPGWNWLTPRNIDGSPTYIIPVMQQYMDDTSNK